LLVRSERFQPRDHSAWSPRPWKWAKGYIRIGTVVRCLMATSKPGHPPQSAAADAPIAGEC
jgi:hypothetical protein